jgi:hypothetical protein
MYPSCGGYAVYGFQEHYRYDVVRESILQPALYSLDDFYREMGDVDGPTIAESVYEELFQNDELDPNVIPYALDDAVQKLRKHRISPHRWATFVHIGA